MKNIFIVDDDAMYTMFMEDHLKSVASKEFSTEILDFRFSITYLQRHLNKLI